MKYTEKSSGSLLEVTGDDIDVGYFQDKEDYLLIRNGEIPIFESITLKFIKNRD